MKGAELMLSAWKKTVKNLASGKYPLYKSLFIVARKGAAPAVRDFLRFVNSAKGRAVAARCGVLVTVESK